MQTPKLRSAGAGSPEVTTLFPQYTTPQQNLEALRNAHVIESELQSGLPRNVKVSGSAWKRFGGKPIVGREMLETGHAVAAVITEVEDRRATQNGFRIVFHYPTSVSPRTVEHLTLSTEEFLQYRVVRGMAFTLLVSPDDEHKVLPYFMVGGCEVLDLMGRPFPRVHRVQPLPRTVLAPIVKSPITPKANIGADPNVESELYCATPRKVVWTRNTNRARLWFANLLAFAGLFLYWALQNSNRSEGMIVMPIFIGSIIAIVWAVSEADWRKHYHYLRSGYAVQATVTRMAKAGNISQYTDITYVYRRRNGQNSTVQLTLFDGDIRHIGELTVGSTFTVLRNTGEDFSPLPYFQIQGVEIPGAPRARATPPAQPMP